MSLRQCAVHPHVRGELQQARSLTVVEPSSSPRARGAVSRTACSIQCARFIPTYAGSSSMEKWEGTSCAVHPHVRGEQVWVVVFTHHHDRFIPTYAGSSHPGRHRYPRGTVHPHVRGEQDDPIDPATLDDGSSPRTRGAGYQRQVGSSSERFIPTYAGSRCLGLSF